MNITVRAGLIAVLLAGCSGNTFNTGMSNSQVKSHVVDSPHEEKWAFYSPKTQIYLSVRRKGDEFEGNYSTTDGGGMVANINGNISGNVLTWRVRRKSFKAILVRESGIGTLNCDNCPTFSLSPMTADGQIITEVAIPSCLACGGYEPIVVSGYESPPPAGLNDDGWRKATLTVSAADLLQAQCYKGILGSQNREPIPSVGARISLRMVGTEATLSLSPTPNWAGVVYKYDSDSDVYSLRTSVGNFWVSANSGQRPRIALYIDESKNFAEARLANVSCPSQN